MTPTPRTIAPYRPFYVRDATNHADIPGRYATHEEAAAARDDLMRRDRHGRLFIVKKKES